MRPRLPTEEETTEVKQWAIVTDLFKAAEQWHARKSEDPTSLNATLWATLMHCMITALLVRVESLVGNDTGLRSSRAAGACRRRQVPLPQVEPQHEGSRKDRPRAPQHCPSEGVPLQIKQNLLFPKVILRFHALRGLSATMTADIVNFHSRDSQPLSRGPADLHCNGEAQLQCSVAPRRGHRAPEQVGQRAAGARRGGSCQEALSSFTDRQVTSLILGNSSNCCYGNSLVLDVRAGCYAPKPA